VRVIPAIDLKDGKCVRLRQGRAEEQTVYSEDPADTARRWERAGAEWLHVVDLDGAFNQRPQNTGAIRKILAHVSIPVQLGGGIRNEETIAEYLDLGVSRVIVGTEAAKRPDWIISVAARHPDRIVVGIDARDGQAAIEGWTATTRIRAIDLALQFDGSDVAAIVFTDIQRDGMQSGTNLEQTRALAEKIHLPVIASGGVSTLQDIEKLLPLEAFGVVGVITGKALYSGSLDLAEALAFCRSRSKNQLDKK
jgi:phosphoribosylformimino-5-aminoimidazole carboxamide ribotide isomerase